MPLDEPIAVSPLWLEFSGLPAWLNKEVRQGAWPVFKKVVELDCQQNAVPDIIDAVPAEIAEWTGVAPEIASRILAKLRSKRLIAGFLGDSPEEPALLQIHIPLKTPISPADVLRDSGKAFLRPGMKLRYAYPIDEPPGDEARLQQVVDLYFNNIGMQINSFILDELRVAARRFPLEKVREAFHRASLNETRQLRRVIRDLVKECPRHEHETPSED